ncbi:MAG: hypothetical protein LBI82_00050 [Dysgonamonadaceae bacterium]|jgi:hypothetical protein|nr:hypothetical protein [Dysgonamonadaceae bacterium]
MKRWLLFFGFTCCFIGICLSQTVPDYKFSVSTTWLSFTNFGEERTNTHHYEFHFKYKLTPKDKIGIKFATWKLFQPMGILWWDGLTEKIDSESEFYPGRLRETGLGVTYQRMMWKGLFTTVEILPQLKTYLDEDNKKIANGFKLYTSYHLGYHIPLFNNRMFIEPQIHCQWWPIDTNKPQDFREIENRWNNYFLFEPNVYIGFNF